MRVIGLDVHRTFGEVVFLEDGVLQSGGRIDLTAERLAAFGRGLSLTDEVVLEATGNTAAIVRALKPFVAQVVIANPLQVRAIAHARVKTGVSEILCSEAGCFKLRNPPADFTLPQAALGASEDHLWVSFPCQRCGHPGAKIHMLRDVQTLQ